MKWTLGLGNWFWLRLISPSSLFLARLLVCSLCPPHFSSLLPFPFATWFFSLVFPHWSWRLISKQWGEEKKQNNTNKVGYLAPPVLLYLTRCLSAQVKAVASFLYFHSVCFIVPASQIICLLWESLQPSCLIFHESFFSVVSEVYRSCWGITFVLFVLFLRFNLTIVQYPNSRIFFLIQRQRKAGSNLKQTLFLSFPPSKV